LGHSTTLVDTLLADPPAVHALRAGPDPDIGLWSTDRDCYLLLAEHAHAGARTLETGSGLSTVLLAAAGADHTCVTPSQAEADRIVTYCVEHGIDTSTLRFVIGPSDEVLPGLTLEPPLDLVFIDGGHGFPMPMIDWYYAGSRLRANGALVLDDVALPAVAQLCAFLDRDPRFQRGQGTTKWSSYRRVDEGTLRQDWFEQPRFSGAPQGLSTVPARAIRKIRRTLGRQRS
jgi:hypothetical protein